jgi:hypothetical protein
MPHIDFYADERTIFIYNLYISYLVYLSNLVNLTYSNLTLPKLCFKY